MGAPASIRVKNKLLSSCGSRTGKGKLRQSAAAPIGEVSLYVSLAALSKLLKSWPEQSCEMSNILQREKLSNQILPQENIIRQSVPCYKLLKMPASTGYLDS